MPDLLLSKGFKRWHSWRHYYDLKLTRKLNFFDKDFLRCYQNMFKPITTLKLKDIEGDSIECSYITNHYKSIFKNYHVYDI